MSKRDEFPKPIQRLIAERAGYICSNCSIGTIGAHSKAGKSLKLGKACHITAAAIKGPRFDPNMTSEDRSSASNGIWLCLKCADMIDKNSERYSADLLRTWKRDQELRIKMVLESSIRLVPQIELCRLSDISNNAQLSISEAKRILGYEENKVNAIKLKESGFNRRIIPRILSDLEKAKESNNFRLIQYIHSYVDSGLSKVPKSWRSLIAGFPIIGQDISSPSLNSIATLASEYHPYLSRSSRDYYHQKVRELLLGVLAESQAFLNDAASAGWFPLIVSAYPSLKRWQDPFRAYQKGISFYYDDALLSGNWSYMVPSILGEHFHDAHKTWSGALFDMISRLPDPDKQRGKLLPSFVLFDVIYSWCCKAPSDFTPPLSNIKRTVVSSSDNTIAGLYKSIAEAGIIPRE
ncbi:MAG: hypothetical protein ABSA18_02815 [Dehalococcoidia bacterium]